MFVSSQLWGFLCDRHVVFLSILQLVIIYVLLYFTLGYSAVISAVVMVAIFPVQYFMSERLGKAHERALVSRFAFYRQQCEMLL